MSEYGFTKKDWALFREKVADWQEAYMDKLNKKYIELLNGEGKPSEKFWALENRIRNDKKDEPSPSAQTPKTKEFYPVLSFS